MTIALPRLDRTTSADRGLTIADFFVPIEVGERLNSRVRDLVLVITGALFIYLTSLIVIQIPGNPIPITGQTFGVLLVGGGLGLRRGFSAVTLYVLLGVIGLPFFAEGRGGVSVIWGASGGYLIGFVAMGAIVGRLAELGWDRKFIGALGAMLAGSVALYAIALPWLKVVTGMSWPQTFETGLVPFLMGDAFKAVLAAVLFPVAWWVVGRRPDDR
jgi:biotin transport system substrate-specific component